MQLISLFFLVFFIPTISNTKSCSGTGCCPKKPVKNTVQTIATQESRPASEQKEIKEIIQEAYGNVVKENGFVCSTGGCCGGGADLSLQMGYTQEELAMFADANLGLGCGHPLSLLYIKKGDIVVDLGSGAGLDCFLAALKTGETGKVIGIDMTQAMINKARQNAEKYNLHNVEFRLADIENLPIESNSVDVIMSNCVINLAPHKDKVFQEAYRVLRPGGVMAISDVVLLEALNDTQKNNPNLICACVGGAILRQDYIGMMEQIGFEVTILDEDKEVNKKWFGDNDLPISSLKFVAIKK